MKRNHQNGVALVVTLLMLSAVTLMAVVFLGVSRREKASVTVTADQTDAKLMADAALARAQSEIIARMLGSTNPYNYDFMVSTNLISPAGFRSGLSSPLNVSYQYANGQPLNNLNDQLQNLVNLQFDPRPPVFIQANRSGAVDFRFYLDFNRNGRFDTNGVQPVLGARPGTFLDPSGAEVTSPSGAEYRHFVGDPEWIGVLERPDRPHSENNRFIGRYAFMILPAGKSLDLNFIHNNAKGTDPLLQANNYSRNQGVGSWEINLAAFLRDLNTNAWRTYQYRSSPLMASLGDSFDDARSILSHRYLDKLDPNRRLESIFDLWGGPTGMGPIAAREFQNDGIDIYSDGPFFANASVQVNPDRLPPGDNPRKAWPGSPNPQGYYDAQDLFQSELTSPFFVRRLLGATTNSTSSYDRYTLYRLLAQMGTDSKPALSNLLYQADFRLHSTNKLHLNYRNDYPNGQTNFVSWDPVATPANGLTPALAARNPSDFFYQAADRLLRSTLATNINTNLPVALAKHFSLGATPVRSQVSITNIQIYHVPTNGAPYYTTNNEYSATVHRCLQVAANLYDAVTTRQFGTNVYPTVFRPVFGKTRTNVFIAGYVEVTNNAAQLLNSMVWRTPQELMQSPDGIYTNANLSLFGVPWVIGAKKGYPNFNEFSMETAVQVSRKLEVRKLSATTFMTNQMYVLGVSNIFGIEAWNSYTQDFRRNIEMRVTNDLHVVLRHIVDNAVRPLHPDPSVDVPARMLLGRTMNMESWTNRTSQSSFVLPLQTNVMFLTNAAYLGRRFPYLFDPNATNNFENSFDPPQWFLAMTNRLQYIVIDRDANRVIDFVNLDNLFTHLDIASAVVGDLNAAGGLFRNQITREADLWLTNRASARAPTEGILRQIGVALGDPNVASDIWRSHIADPVTGADKQKSIEKFRDFFRLGNTNLAMQVPFTPTRKIYQRNTWQVNDPLVHYMAEDLTDPILTGSTNSLVVIRPPNTPLPQSNLGLMNERYRPWGGNPNKSTDDTNFRMTLKDPGVRASDDWEFPTNKLANLGLMGRIHRGTPWQTIYLKAGMETPEVWLNWSGSLGTHPTNDWKFVDLFTVAPHENAARGLLSVNQTNLAAWSAVLSGVSVLSNATVNPGPLTGMTFDDVLCSPSSPQLHQIVGGITRTKLEQPYQVFRTVGDVLAVPELTIASPFLNLTTRQRLERGLTDPVVERIPQQILSLLKTDEPRIVVYAFGQSLKPAERSLVTSGNFYNICTNYQITGELVTKTVLRVEDTPEKPRVVVESYSIVPPE